jgi:hypothetical protein
VGVLLEGAGAIGRGPGTFQGTRVRVRVETGGASPGSPPFDRAGPRGTSRGGHPPARVVGLANRYVQGFRRQSRSGRRRTRTGSLRGDSSGSRGRSGSVAPRGASRLGELPGGLEGATSVTQVPGQTCASGAGLHRSAGPAGVGVSGSQAGWSSRAPRSPALGRLRAPRGDLRSQAAEQAPRMAPLGAGGSPGWDIRAGEIPGFRLRWNDGRLFLRRNARSKPLPTPR